MCGRFTLALPVKDLSSKLEEFSGLPAQLPFEWMAHYNISPGMKIPVLWVQGGAWTGELQGWGFVPHWVKSPERYQGWHNARLETAREKPAFKDAFAKRRCIIPASGFYEWEKSRRIPYYASHKASAESEQGPEQGQGSLLFFAGIWDEWIDPRDQLKQRNCAILTQESRDEMLPIHHRMPVFLAETALMRWLEEGVVEAASAPVHVHPVGPAINSSKAQGSELCARVDLQIYDKKAEHPQLKLF